MHVPASGKWKVISDISAYEASENPAGGAIDSNPFGILAEPGRRLVVDAGANALLEVRANGNISTLAVFPSRPEIVTLRLMEYARILSPSQLRAIRRRLKRSGKFPNAVAHDASYGVEDYIKRAGGYSQKADTSRIIVAHRDGSFDEDPRGSEVRPGDDILVLPRPDSRPRQFWKDIVQIVFQIAAITKIVLND